KLPSFVPKEMQELVTSMINPNPQKRPEIKDILEQSTIKMYIRLQDGKRRAEERALASDERTRIALEQLRDKDAQIQHLQTEINQLRRTQLSDNSSQLENPDSSGQGSRLERIGGLLRKATILNQQFLSVPLNKVISSGIHRISVKFGKCNLSENVDADVGIVKANYKVPYPCHPMNPQLDQFVIKGNRILETLNIRMANQFHWN
ncbi:MAG: hypothetical protein EZS28_048149, partial [Streblomastix strix]